MSNLKKNVHALLLIIILTSTKATGDNFCGNRTYFQEPKGKIETSFEVIGDIVNCTWSIVTPKNSAIHIRIDFLQLGSYDERYEKEGNWLHLTSLDTKVNFMKICSDTSYFDTLSVPTNELLISLQTTSESYLSLTYTSYIVNCSYHELKCYTSRFFSRKTNKLCTDGMLVCDNSCRYGTIICGDFCYDIQKQRCNGIIDCPTAEDELGCNPRECPNKIRCSDEPKCLSSHQICDENLDCKNGFDESHCSKFFCKEDEPNCNIERSRENDQEIADLTYIIAVIFAVMVMTFVYLICKCLSSRDDVRNMMDDHLDVPLPPFRGPGETSTEDVPFTNDDFRPGGDIFESFAANIEKIKNRRRNKTEDDDKNITFVRLSNEQGKLNKHFNGLSPVISEEMAALATLKITRDMCRGLKKTRSEERPMTRLLFIDNRDDDLSDNSEEDNEATFSKPKKTNYRPTHSKSDTDYVRRKGATVSFV